MLNNNQTGGALWQPEHIDALREHLTEGKSFARIAVLINQQFGTAYTRNSMIGKSHRLGLKSINPSGVNISPPRVRKPKAQPATEHKIRRKFEVITILPANGNSSAVRLRRTTRLELAELRCVPIEPRNLTLLDLERGDCRYPYGDRQIIFCGHPVIYGSSYCAGHHHLCWVRPISQKARVWHAA